MSDRDGVTCLFGWVIRFGNHPAQVAQGIRFLSEKFATLAIDEPGPGQGYG
jgi:hypothetical protein